MDLEEPILIISDLHLGHTASAIKQPEQLAPLFREAATVVFNGDATELLFLQRREEAQQLFARLNKVCQAEGAQPIFINGNHDPEVSDVNHLDLYEGAVLVTHGDVMFHEITPWSNKGKLLGAEHTRVLNELVGSPLPEFELRLQAAKRASLVLERKGSLLPRGKREWLGKVKREVWPPARLFRLLEVWAQTPARAVELMQRYRPQARFILIGHTHRAGVWKLQERVVINTGSFAALAGLLAVRLEGDALTVHRIKRRARQFCLGRTKDRFEIAPLHQAVTLDDLALT